MVSARVYDAFYRWWTPWDSVGVRQDLRSLLASGRVSPSTHPRAVDLGCGTGANVVFLADSGFDAWGIDFSAVALRRAEVRRAEAGVGCHFVRGDLTAPSIDGVEGPFDLMVDFGTLDDLRGDARSAMVRTIDRLARPGTTLLSFCFFGSVDDLPRVSLTGPSRLSGTIKPGEMEQWFGDRWNLEVWNDYPGEPFATFVLVRR
ncbi:MAG: class I SAM-dependent methyltransferase [Acidimicrobiia bacterium]